CPAGVMEFRAGAGAGSGGGASSLSPSRTKAFDMREILRFRLAYPAPRTENRGCLRVAGEPGGEQDMAALEKQIEKDDLLTRMRVREVLLFGLIAMSAILAQLPHEVLEDYGINRNYLLGVLGCGIVLGLFFYLKFFFFLAVVLLILGANLDQQLADYVNISKVPLVLALVAMVGIQLINYFVHLMPTGLEEKPKEKSPEGVR